MRGSFVRRLTKPGSWTGACFGVLVQAVANCNLSKALDLLSWRDSEHAASRQRNEFYFPKEPDCYDSTAAGAWFARARVNAEVARLIVSQNKPELLVEAVTQLQQAVEKATKGLMIVNGMPREYVERLQHNTSGAFLELMVHIMTQHQDNLDWNALELAGGPRAGSDLIRLVFPKQRQINRKVKLQRIWGKFVS